MSAFVHMELATNDPERAKAFYKGLFGWKLTDMKMPDGNVYTMFDTRAGGPGGGIMAKADPSQPTAWLAYVGVKSLNKSMEKAKSLGAMPIIESQTVPNYGSFGIFADPTGAVIALWEPAPRAAQPALRKKAAKKTAKKKSGRKKK